jgi:hypothetical protein
VKASLALQAPLSEPQQALEQVLQRQWAPMSGPARPPSAEAPQYRQQDRIRRPTSPAGCWFA